MSEHHTHPTASDEHETGSTSEGLGIFFLLIGLLLGISLFTYNPQDPSFSTAITNPVIENAIGKGGAIASDILFQIFGLSAYFIPVFLIGYGIRCLKKHPAPYSIRSIFGWGLLMVTLLTFSELIADEQTLLNHRGGVFGVILGQILSDYLGQIGAPLLLAFSFLFGAMLIFPFSPSNLIGMVLAPLGALFGGITQQMAKIIKKPAEKKSLPHTSINKKLKEDHGDSDDETTDEVEPFDDSEETEGTLYPSHISDAEEVSFSNADSNGYQLPPLSLLIDSPPHIVRATPEEFAAQAKILKRKLGDFGISGEVQDIHPGPVVTLFEFEPAPGIKLSRITTLADDLALVLRAPQVRIVPRIPGKAAVGIELPNRTREGVFLKEILESPSFARLASKTRIALGKDISGAPIAADLADMPHLLIAGATGSGKSVGLNSVILSILFSATPNEVKLLLIDPKMLELSLYEDIPHLFAPVITRPHVAAGALRKMVEEMQRRYELLAQQGVRNIEAYNKLCRAPRARQDPDDKDTPPTPEPPLTPLPYIIIFIDELADLMVVASREVEESIGRLAQMARAAGIHLVLATQRPSVDVLTGVIKANFTARIAYAVTTKIDSRTILDANGAEQLLGKGDMLYLSSGTSRLLRIHGAYVSEEEVKRVVGFIKKQGHPTYQQVFSEEALVSSKESALDARDELYEKACDLVFSTGQASASFIQRRLRVGYPRAARMIELMEEDGLVGPAVGSKPREVRKER